MNNLNISNKVYEYNENNISFYKTREKFNNKTTNSNTLALSWNYTENELLKDKIYDYFSPETEILNRENVYKYFDSKLEDIIIKEKIFNTIFSCLETNISSKIYYSNKELYYKSIFLKKKNFYKFSEYKKRENIILSKNPGISKVKLKKNVRNSSKNIVIEYNIYEIIEFFFHDSKIISDILNLFIEISNNLLENFYILIGKKDFIFELDFFRFSKLSQSVPEWHRNVIHEETYRINSYIETSGYNTVDLMLADSNINQSKLLILDIKKHNTLLWKDWLVQHRTPKNITNENIPRSFISIFIKNNSFAIKNNKNKFGRLYPLVLHPNHIPKIKSNYLHNGGKSIRKCPKNPAKEFKLKTVKKGLDGKMWIVSKRSDGVKVWKRKNNTKGNKGGNNKNKYSTNYSRFNKITGNENLENVFNSGTIISNKDTRPLVTGKKNIVSNLFNHEEGLVRAILDKDLTGYELKNLMFTSKKMYNNILKNLIFLLPKLKDSKVIYNIILRKLLNKDLPKDDKLYINYDKVRNHINSSNKETLSKLLINNINNKNQQKNINYVLQKLSEKNQKYLLHLFTYASNIAMLQQGVLVIPYGTIVINAATYRNYKIHTAIIPDSVSAIGAYAFYECRSLTSIAIPDSVTTIGKGAFFECRSLASITIPDSVTTIGYSAFFDCSSLASITISDSVTNIEDKAFYGCIRLKTIYVSQNRINSNNRTIEESLMNSKLSLSNINIIPVLYL